MPIDSTDSLPGRRLQGEHGRHPPGIGQAQQAVADAGEAVHQARRFDAAARAAEPAVAGDAGEDNSGLAVDRAVQSRIAQRIPGLEEEVEVAQVAMALAVVLAEAALDGLTDGLRHLVAQGAPRPRLADVGQSLEPREAD